jgi:hypothetical protein
VNNTSIPCDSSGYCASWTTTTGSGTTTATVTPMIIAPITNSDPTLAKAQLAEQIAEVRYDQARTELRTKELQLQWTADVRSSQLKTFETSAFEFGIGLVCVVGCILTINLFVGSVLNLVEQWRDLTGVEPEEEETEHG